LKIIRYIPESVKRTARKLIKKIKFLSFKNKAEKHSIEDLKSDLKKLGIKEGDILYTHSSMKSLGYLENGAATVISAMMEVVGKEGTLIFPSFTVPFSMQETLRNNNQLFDPETDESTTGKIPETFRKMPFVKRSLHATHSVSAWGKYADYITSEHYGKTSNFGMDTPFAKMLELDVKIVGLGVGFEPVTFYHVFEDINPDLFKGVYLEEMFHPKIKTPTGIIATKQFAHNPSFYKRRIDKNPEIENYFHEHMNSSGKMVCGIVGSSISWWMQGTEFMKELEVLYSKGKTIYDV
jgi:aminoglycoside N3'-acetyltransferase